MMTRRATFKQADATKALRAAVAAGLFPTGYQIDPVTGTITVQFSGVGEAGNSFDQLTEVRP
jgi:hypothetical protein